MGYLRFPKCQLFYINLSLIDNSLKVVMRLDKPKTCLVRTVHKSVRYGEFASVNIFLMCACNLPLNFQNLFGEYTKKGIAFENSLMLFSNV